MYIIKRFEDRIVAVTGGAKGIGKACCLRFAEEGAKVAVMDLALGPGCGRGVGRHLFRPATDRSPA